MRLPAPELPQWLASQLPFDRYLVSVGGRRMHLMEGGEGPTVLMQHGNPTWGYLYRKVATRLMAEGFRVIMPDLIGLGLSDKPTTPEVHQLENHCLWFKGLLEVLGIQETIFVGQDWGGPIGLGGLGGLAQSDTKIRGLVLMNTVASEPRPGFRPTAFHRFSQLPLLPDLLFRGLGFPQNGLHRVQGEPASIGKAERRAYVYPLRRLRDRVAPLALARMAPTHAAHPSVRALKKIGAFARAYQGPAELVWGNRDPVLGRAKSRVKSLFPDAPVTETSAGHFLQEEVPEEIAAAIARVAYQTLAMLEVAL